MRRPPVAVVGALAFILLYVAAAVVLPERLPPMHPALQAVYWCAAGILWVFPVRWLMLWAVDKR